MMDRFAFPAPWHRLALSIAAALVASACHATPTNAVESPSTTAIPSDAGLQQRIDALKAKTRKELVPIKGGSFTMGDFGPLDPRVEMPYTGERDDDVLRKVTLSSFAMSALKVTYADFDVFTEATGQPKVAQQEMDLAYRDLPNIPAGVNWHDAQAYCQWIGQQIGRRMDLPTEAQWEYAARNRGQMIVWATDNGVVENGRNVASSDQHRAFTGEHPGALMTPIGQFPPTPLGLYDMIDHGFEWIRDWYAPAYEPNEKRNPQGPKTGTEKVQRSHSSRGGDTLAIVSMTMTRFHRVPSPLPRINPIDGTEIPSNPNFWNTFRCVAEGH